MHLNIWRKLYLEPIKVFLKNLGILQMIPSSYRELFQTPGFRSNKLCLYNIQSENPV